MKIIDGKDAVLGRLASYVAQEALKGEEIIILNCEQIKITGNKRFIQKDFEAKRGRVGSTQNGPKVSRTSEKIVKRAIRGMLPNYRTGRGREAFKRIKCYNSIPKEFEDKKKIVPGRKKTKISSKFIRIKEIAK
ncbi:MAG: 50S ribosomal protein L13 [Candidatus Pacearchaeota archaeon]|nr:50S ribosomal protein L13 [Candidatus Pacearchaeota archaeon]